MEKLEIYNLSQDYIEYLSKFDNKVCWTKGDMPFGRKYVGILLNVNNVSYFAPLTSSIWNKNQQTGNLELKKHFTDVYLKDRHDKYRLYILKEKKYSLFFE